jgi:hypothetical protein
VQKTVYQPGHLKVNMRIIFIGACEVF